MTERHASECCCYPCWVLWVQSWTPHAPRPMHPAEATAVARAAKEPRPLVHGTYAGYVRGCHEECCRAAARDYSRQRRAAKRRES